MRLRPVYGLLVTLLGAGLVSQPAYAKDKCARLIKETNDPLDGKFHSFEYFFERDVYSAVDGVYKNGVWTIHLRLVSQGDVDKQGVAGEVAKFAVGGQILEIPATKDTLPITNVSAGGFVYTRWLVEYTLTPEQIKQLASAPVEAIGVTVGGEVVRMRVEVRGGKKVQQVFACAAALSGG